MNNDGPTIQIVVELVTPNGQGFITEAYRNLHGREPDTYGRAHCCGRMKVGYSKRHIMSVSGRRSY